MTGRPVPWDRIERDRADRAARAPGAPRDFGSCEGPTCTAKIRWAVTAEGRRMPVDFAPDRDGNLVRVMVARGDWRIRVLAAGETPPAGELRWTSHYATCPDAAWFRARGKTGQAAPASARPAPAQASPSPDRAQTAPAPVLLAVDGNSLAHRAWHGYQKTGMTDPDGRPVHAVYGFLRLLAGICDRARPDALLVGFDDPAASVRRDRYPGYKSGRKPTDPDLRAQLGEILAVLGELGVATVIPPGLEADDVTASAAFAAATAGWRCVIATSDKDAFSLVTDTTTVLRLVSGLDNAQEITPGALVERYGVTPGQWLDYVALVGDPSDNLPGVTGVGPKTAAKLLATCGSLEAALADPAAASAAIGSAAAAKLAVPEARAVIDRNQQIMAAVRDVPVDPHRCRPATAPETVAAVLRDRHLPSLTGRVTAVLCRPATPQPAPAPAAQSAGPRRAVLPLARLEAGVAPALVCQQPPPVCPDCGAAVAAVLPLAAVGDAGLVLVGEVLVDRAHPTGDLVVVRVGDGWAVRQVAAGEMYLPPAARRQTHRCPRYAHDCAVCGEPARMYPAGPRCPAHARGGLWCCAPAGKRLIPIRCARRSTPRYDA